MHLILIFVVVALFALFVRSRVGRISRYPLDIYLGFYTLTSVIGGLIIGFPETRELWILYSATGGMDFFGISSTPSQNYWVLLFMPFVLVPSAALAVEVLAKKLTFRGSIKISMKILDPGLLVTLSFVLAMLFLTVVDAASNDRLTTVMGFSSNINFVENVYARYNVFESANSLVFPITYVMMPCIAIYSLIRASGETDRLAWYVLFGISGLAAIYLVLAVFLKSFIILFFLMVTLALLLDKRVGFKFLVSAATTSILIFAILGSLQSANSQLDILRSAGNIIFRMAVSLPFVVELFPDIVPYAGLNVGFRFLNIGPDIAINLVLHNYMFPHVTEIQGLAPAPAHITAYAEGGILWAGVISVFIGLSIGLLGQLGKYARSASAKTVFLYGCIGSYYFSQTVFWNAFLVSYGFKWALYLFVGMLLFQYIIRGAIMQSQIQRMATNNA